MKWTTLRLNMLPITAVEVQYACQTLTNLHNALVDALTKQSSPLSRTFPTKSVPFFTSAQNFLPITIQKSKIPINDSQTQKMTYDKLIVEYEKIKNQVQEQIKQLNTFYVKHSHDSSSSLFHMLKLRLERVIFDCNNEKTQMKKVLTAAEQQKQYKEIAKQFQSKNSKTQPVQNLKNANNPKSNPDTKYLQSWDTFKTQNYPGYQNDSLQLSKNQFFQLQNDNYEPLNFDLKPQRKQYISQNILKSKSKPKPKQLPSPTHKYQNTLPSKSPTSKTLLKKQPTSQLTIATERDNQKGHIPKKQIKKNFTKIQTQQTGYKNLKVLTNNNVPTKITNKKQIQTKTPKQTFSNTYTNTKITATKKTTEITEKTKGYTALNQKKEQMKKKPLNVNQNQTQKSTVLVKNQPVQKGQKKQRSPSKSPETPKLQPRKVATQDISKNKVEQKKPSPSKSPKKQSKKQQKEMNDLKQMLMSSGSELRFTIKMSREEYKSLLEFKNKVNNKKV